jgi:hypothetical protein
MSFPKLPDWLIYGTVVAAMLAVSLVRRDYADAPPAPPPPDAREGALVGPNAPVDPLNLVQAPQGPLLPVRATAFAISAQGRWLTARHAVAKCAKAAILMGGGLAIPADIRVFGKSDMALLVTQGGPTALPLGAPKPPADGQKAFVPGYPRGRPGELALRYLGRDKLKLGGRDSPEQPVLAWAEIGRTSQLGEELAGLSGAPILDGQGRVLGVALTERPRRGRIYSTDPSAMAAAEKIVAPAHELAVGQLITTENYGRVADGLRRDARVAEVRCLTFR